MFLPIKNRGLGKVFFNQKEKEYYFNMSNIIKLDTFSRLYKSTGPKKGFWVWEQLFLKWTILALFT